jgi:hypothetical protein
MNSSLSLNKLLYQNSNSSTSTLRPRNSRLISYTDDNATPLPTDNASSPKPKGPPFPSRGVSPLPGLRQERADGGIAVTGKQTHTRPTSEHNAISPPATLWDSWSSLQGIASTLLGSDVQSNGKDDGVTRALWRRKQNTAVTNTRDWGLISDLAPRLLPDPAEERQAMAQAKKREALLLAHANEGRDANGRYKRRDSNSDFFRYMDSSDQQEDDLVYVHIIQPHDTLAGVTIKYNCQPEIFRKANRFWPNDNIQTRKHVFIPVDACSIRGKKLDTNFDLLSEDEHLHVNNSSSSTDYMGPIPIATAQTTSSPPTHTHSPSSLIENSKHESWVQLPGFPAPVEILRLPCRTLGYFPPARRKSITSPSETSTPKSSFDMLRHPPTHAASLNASPVRRPRLQPQPTRQRSSSTTTTSRSFADHLKGPGGVGTLQGLRTEASRPGPGEDPLTRKFAQYLPDLAPPEDFSKTPFRPTPRATPRASTDSIRSNSSASLGEMSGTIEGWVRKLAGPKSNKAGPTKMGDLIELETNSEMSDLLEGGEEVQTPTMLTDGGAQTTATEASLNERFPARGRVRNAYAGGND